LSTAWLLTVLIHHRDTEYTKVAQRKTIRRTNDESESESK